MGCDPVLSRVKGRLYFATHLFLLLIASSVASAQRASEGVESFRRNRIALVLGHTHVPAGIDENGKKTWLALASWGLDYDFRINQDWGLGLHSDLVIQDFEYEEDEGIVKNRTKPVAIAFVGTRRLGEHFTILTGGGMEVAPEGTLGLIRIGTDCGWELPKDWELSLSLMADFKINAYDAWVLGFGIGKLF
ncbi:MAG TPA: hypothetical protein VFW11_15355 [Cyclobacteriaceae bacterium]|nr:hypothetical protein [Cyclobacteriaceae bacterium]